MSSNLDVSKDVLKTSILPIFRLGFKNLNSVNFSPFLTNFIKCAFHSASINLTLLNSYISSHKTGFEKNGAISALF